MWGLMSFPRDSDKAAACGASADPLPDSEERRPLEPKRPESEQSGAPTNRGRGPVVGPLTVMTAHNISRRRERPPPPLTRGHF